MCIGGASALSLVPCLFVVLARAACNNDIVDEDVATRGFPICLADALTTIAETVLEEVVPIGAEEGIDGCAEEGDEVDHAGDRLEVNMFSMFSVVF